MSSRKALKTLGQRWPRHDALIKTHGQQFPQLVVTIEGRTYSVDGHYQQKNGVTNAKFRDAVDLGIDISDYAGEFEVNSSYLLAISNTYIILCFGFALY